MGCKLITYMYDEEEKVSFCYILLQPDEKTNRFSIFPEISRCDLQVVTGFLDLLYNSPTNIHQRTYWSWYTTVSVVACTHSVWWLLPGPYLFIPLWHLIHSLCNATRSFLQRPLSYTGSWLAFETGRYSSSCEVSISNRGWISRHWVQQFSYWHCQKGIA